MIDALYTPTTIIRTDKKEGHPIRNAPHLYYVKTSRYGLHLFLFIDVDVLSIDHAFVLLRLFMRFRRTCSTIGRC